MLARKGGAFAVVEETRGRGGMSGSGLMRDREGEWGWVLGLGLN